MQKPPAQIEMKDGHIIVSQGACSIVTKAFIFDGITIAIDTLKIMMNGKYWFMMSMVAIFEMIQLACIVISPFS